MTVEALEEAGISRFDPSSIGIESVEDLIEDLEKGLELHPKHLKNNKE